MEVFWFIPSHGDGRYLGTAHGGRQINHAYLAQIAKAVDHLGYHGALLPTGRSCEDAWVVASSLLALTQRMRFLVAIRPGLTSPGVAARMAATFDRLSEGRLLINIVTGGDPSELAGDGLHLSHDERYELTDEFLSVWRGLASGEKVNFQGKHLKIDNGSILFRPRQSPYPPLYFGGSSEPALRIAAKHVALYLTWGEPLGMVQEKIERVRALAKEEGRTLRFGIRLHVIVRDTDQEAWAAADELISHMDDETIAASQKNLSRHDSEGQRRMRELHNGRRDSLVVAPNLWAGVGLARGGAGTALVGDAETVAIRMKEYASLGIDTFILSGYPHLEEAYRTAELLFPHLPMSQAGGPKLIADEAIGEIVGNKHFPAVPQAAG